MQACGQQDRGGRQSPAPSTAAAQSACRRDADETARHSPTRLNTAQYRPRAEALTVQHLCAQAATPRHACRVFPKPGVAGSIPAGGTMLFLLRASSFVLPPCRLLPNRQNCRHFADETRRHTPRRRRTRSHEGGCRGSWSSLAVGALRHPNLGVGSCAGVGSCFWGLVQTAESLLGLATVGRSVGAV